MDRRALAIAVVVVVAGCGAPFGGGGNDENRREATVTPAPAPSVTERPEQTPSVAPGVRTVGIGDLDRLVRAHVRAARNASWVWTESYALTRRSGNATDSDRFGQTVRFVSPQRYSREAAELGIRTGQDFLFVQNYTEYADGTTAYQKWRSQSRNRIIYQHDDTPTANRSFAGFAAEPIRTYLALDEATVSRVDRGERQYYRIVGTAASVSGYESVDTYRASAVVRADGFVRSLNVTYTTATIRRQYSFTYRTVDDLALERPEWVDTAANRTSG